MTTATQHSKCAIRVAGLLLSLMAPACAVFSPAVKQVVVEDPEQHVQVVAIGSVDARKNTYFDAMGIQRIASLQLQIADYPVAGAQRSAWQAELSAVEMLAQHAYAELALQRLQALENTVQSTTEKYFAQHAENYLQQARQFSFLNSEQSGRLRAAELAMELGKTVVVYQQARALVRELWSADDWAVVRPGDTLNKISARPEVYDNARLWPLLKAANKGYFYRQLQPQIGWKLRYPRHPRLDEIFAAVEGQLAP